MPHVPEYMMRSF